MPNAIPTAQRDLVKQRERFLCLRCGGRGTDWHHRRRRAVGDDHQHCSCNGVWLCRTDHRWAHDNPSAARADGFIVSSFTDQPGQIPVRSFHGLVTLTCTGKYE